MASGSPDWWIRTKTDIVAQTIANLDVDIIAQTLANLKVDINAQTIGNLAVDLNAQTIGNLAIDINAQTIDNLTFDIVKQTLSFLTVRPAYGSAIQSDGSVSVPNITETPLVSVNHQGIVYNGIIEIDAAVDPNDCHVKIEVDGNEIFYASFKELLDNSFLVGCNATMVLVRYDTINENYIMSLVKGITFETSFELMAFHSTGANLFYYFDVLYALTP